MSGLILRLGPHERVMINGAVIENGATRSRVTIVSPGAQVLRLRDAIHPDAARTPVRRVCYIAQLLLLGEAEREEGHRQLMTGLEQLARVFTDQDSRRHLERATDAALRGDYYPTMKALRALIPREDRLLAVAGA